MINIKDSAEFERLLKALSDDIIDAHIHYQLYQDLIEAITKYPLVVQQSNIFWTHTLQAHLNSSVFALFRAYDQHLRSLHLRSWLTTIEENLHLFDDKAFRERLKDNPYVASLVQDVRKPDPAVLAEDIALCSSTDPIVKKLTIYRGNRIAHRNAKFVLSSEDLPEKYGLTFDELRTLLVRAKTILNRYSYLFAATVYSTKVVGHDDFAYIFECIQQKVEESRRQWMP
jgi:AbiU2